MRNIIFDVIMSTIRFIRKCNLRLIVIQRYSAADIYYDIIKRKLDI